MELYKYRRVYKLQRRRPAYGFYQLLCRCLLLMVLYFDAYFTFSQSWTLFTSTAFSRTKFHVASQITQAILRSGPYASVPCTAWLIRSISSIYFLCFRSSSILLWYIWKILEDFIPNLDTKISPFLNDLFGRLYTLNPLKSRDAVVGNVNDNSKIVRGPTSVHRATDECEEHHDKNPTTSSQGSWTASSRVH